MRQRSGFRRLVTLLVAVSAFAALAAVAARFRTEMRNRRVSITVDYLEAERLATGAGVSVREVLRKLEEAGATSVAVTEEMLPDLEEQGLAQVSGTQRLATVRLADATLLDRVTRAWELRGVPSDPEPQPSRAPYTLLWSPDRPGRSAVFRGSIVALAQVGTGLPERALANAAALGMEPVARIANYPGASQRSMEAVLADLSRDGVRIVICPGTEVFGYFGRHREAAEAFRQSRVYFGQVEFGKQKGDAQLGSALRGEYVRVHSISEGEMGTLSEAEAVERFVRAARERNIRVCYVRLLTLAGTDALVANARYIATIARGITRESLLSLGAARPFSEPHVPVLVFPLIGLGVGALTALLIVEALPEMTWYRWWLLLVLCVACAAMVVFGDTGRKLVALLVAVVAPSLAALPFVRMMEGCQPGGEPLPLRKAVATAVGMFASSSAVTALGVLPLVGLLASRSYMVKANQFLGIKAAHGLPILITAVLLVVGLPAAGESMSAAWHHRKQRAQVFLSQPVLVGMLVLTLVLLAAVGLALMRTGNDPGVGVSGLELQFRSLLDAILPARPRTKEFLIGHPALVLAAVLTLRGQRRWAVPALLAGVLGQASLLNTFCHIHTPLVVSVVRAVIGLLLGAMIGVGLSYLVCRLAGQPAHKPPSTG